MIDRDISGKPYSWVDCRIGNIVTVRPRTNKSGRGFCALILGFKSSPQHGKETNAALVQELKLEVYRSPFDCTKVVYALRKFGGRRSLAQSTSVNNITGLYPLSERLSEVWEGPLDYEGIIENAF